MSKPMVFDEMPVGAVVRSHWANGWRKRADGLWDVLTDPSWGPCASGEIPRDAKREVAK